MATGFFDQYGEIGMTIFTIALVVGFGLLLYFAVNRGLKMSLDRDGIEPSIYHTARAVLKWAILLLVSVLVLQQAGIKITSIVTVLLTITGMIAIGFIAVWSILSNVSCAILLMVYDLFRIGDEIEIIEPVGGSGLRGTVLDFNLMYVILQEARSDGNGHYHTQVPNNVFFQKTIRHSRGEKTKKLGQHLLAKSLTS